MASGMYKIPLVDESGRTIGYGDRWWTHRVRDEPGGPILGRKHIGITIACLDKDGRILVQHRRHRIFDRVWSLSGDTHPRKYGNSRVESLREAARRCAEEDLGITIRNWTRALSVSYSARDPHDPRYCENELLYLLVAKCTGLVQMNKENAYELRSVELAEISKDVRADLSKEPIDRRYAPWVHAVFSLPSGEIEEAFRALVSLDHQGNGRQIPSYARRPTYVGSPGDRPGSRVADAASDSSVDHRIAYA